MTALAILLRDQIIERIAAGHTRNQVAKDLGITGAAISQQLANDPEYIAAKETGTEQRLDQAEEGIAAADSMLTLARNTNWWKAVSWRAEREHAHRWGQRPTVQVGMTVQVDTIERRIVRPGSAADVESKPAPTDPQPPQLANSASDLK